MYSYQINLCKMFVFLALSMTVVSGYFFGVQAQNERSITKLTSANNHFAFNLHRRLTADASEQNVFFSPLSLSMAFGMLLLGARGNTAKELRNGLGFQRAGLSDELVHLTFNRLLTGTLSENSPKGYTLNIANGILVDRQLRLNPDYKREADVKYRAPVQNADIAQQTSKVKDSINNWINIKTHGKIQRLMDDLSPETVMVILNAVYFKGLWKIPFDPSETFNHTFYNNGQESQVKEVPMMNMGKTTHPYALSENFQVLELPYEGDIAMLILLPTERNGLPALEASLTLDQFNSIRRSMEPTEISVFLPKFKIEYSKTLNKAIQALGMKNIFQTPDLSGISRATGLKVSEIVHKAFVSVDEFGTEAAAATGFGLMPYSGASLENMFIADHPFLFAIFDKKSDMILFMGRVNSL